MKRFLNVFLVIVFGFLLSSCTNYDSFIFEFEDTMNRLTSDGILASNITMEVTAKRGTYLEKGSEKVEMIIMNDPVFIQVKTGSNCEVIAEEGNEILKYYISSSGEIIGTISLGSKDDFLRNEYDSVVYDPNNLDISLDSIRKKNDIYVLKGKFGDIVDLDSQIGELYESLNVDASIIENSDVTMKFDIQEQSILMNMVMSFKAAGFKFTVDTNISFIEPDPKEIEWCGKVPGYSFKNYIEAEVGDEISFNEKVYKIDFEEGQYAFVNKNEFSFDEDANYKIFDLTGKELDLNFSISLPETTRVKHTFIIPKAGTYFIKTDSSYIRMQLVKINCDSNFNEAIEVTNGTYSGSIDGGFEFIKYAIESDFEGVYKISNNSSNSFTIIRPSSDSLYRTDEIVDTEYIRLHKGTNVFYICANDYLSTEKTDYSFTLELLEPEPKPKLEFSELTELPSEQNRNMIIVGSELPASYFKFTVPERGIYTFKANAVDEEYNNFNLYFYDADTNQLVHSIYSSDGYLAIEPGEYIVEVTTYDHLLSIGSIYYKYEGPYNI